jgi:hypothetical protein
MALISPELFRTLGQGQVQGLHLLNKYLFNICDLPDTMLVLRIKTSKIQFLFSGS